MQPKLCSCGTKMTFIEVFDPKAGKVKKVPIDLSAPVYQVTSWHPDDATIPVTGTPTKMAFVNHFKTCPDAKKFSGRNRTR